MGMNTKLVPFYGSWRYTETIVKKMSSSRWKRMLYQYKLYTVLTFLHIHSKQCYGKPFDDEVFVELSILMHPDHNKQRR